MKLAATFACAAVLALVAAPALAMSSASEPTTKQGEPTKKKHGKKGTKHAKHGKKHAKPATNTGTVPPAATVTEQIVR